jgi:hypothetical protein
MIGRADVKGTALVPIPFGELIDKITILRIKAKQIGDPAKIASVRRELELLDEARVSFAPTGDGMRELESELEQVNGTLWNIEDRIRDCERRSDFGPEFIRLARAVYQTNDRRAALKRRLSEMAGSAIVEEKSYAPWARPPRPDEEKPMRQRPAERSSE